MNHKENELVAIMFADIVNYTAIMRKSESKAKLLLEAFQANISSLVPKFHGEIVNFYGDGCLIKFYSVESALNAAKEIQNIFLSEDLCVPARMGIHLGDVFNKDGNIYGTNVNIASRIESFGIPGSILFSEEVYSQISNKEGFSYKNLGKVNFKNDNRERTLYALVGGRLVIPKREDLMGKGKLSSKKQLIYVICAAILLILTILFLIKFNSSSEHNTFEEKSIAVLPLSNLTRSSEDLEYYSDGLTAEIVDELAKIGSFNITSFTQSVYYKNSDKSYTEIAEELSVNYILSGSIRLISNQQIKLSIELFNPFTNERIWYDNFVDSLVNAQNIQIKVANQIAGNLNVELSPAEQLSLEKLNTVDGEAFRLFLKAKSELDKFSASGFNKAQDYLNQAIEIDSNYAQAYTLKAWTILLSADPQIIPSSSKDLDELDLVNVLLEKSKNIRPDLSDTYLVQSSYSLYSKNKIKDAIDDVEYAIQLKSWPRVPTNYCTCAMISAMISGHDFERAREIIQIAEKIDPANILQLWDKGNIELAQGNLEESVKYYRKAYKDEPLEYFRAYLAISLYHLENYNELINLYTDFDERDETLSSLSLAYLSNAHFKLREKNKSEYFLNRIEERENLGNTNLYLAIIYIGRNEYNEALTFFEKAYEMNEFGMANMSSIDPIFRSLTKFPKFQEIRSAMQF